MAQERNLWPKRISVDKRIVKILSESTYENFPTALKEIITNSYDADASLVSVNINLKKGLITIEDNGKGMSVEEFDFFLRIAGVKREREKNTTASGRYVLGKFGVGFLSIFPYFRNYDIESKKKGSDRVLISSIPCYKYFSSDKLVEVSEIPINGKEKIDKSRVNESYTRITLSGFTELANEYFFPSNEIEYRKYSVYSYTGIQKLRWKLEEDLPIDYEDERFNVLTRHYSPNLKFKVFVNGEILTRKTYATEILEINGEKLSFKRGYSNGPLKVTEDGFKEIGKIRFQYFILTNKIALRPYEARGFKIRNLNAGVGERTTFRLGSEAKGGRSRLQWLTGEVLVLEGMNDIINVQRTDFYYDPDYDRLKEFLIERLSHHSNLLEEEAEFDREKKDQKIKNLRYLEQSDEEPGLTKTIRFHNRNYKVKIDTWDYRSDFYPACKVESGKLLINKSYPLFSRVKHTDIFIRLHLLMVISQQEGRIKKTDYSTMAKEILEIYKEYI